MFSVDDILDLDFSTTYTTGRKKIEIIVNGDSIEHYHKNKLVYSRLNMKNICDLKLKHSTTLNSKRFYNLIIKLDKRIDALEEQLQQLKFKTSIKYNEYVVYGIGTARNYYTGEKNKCALVKTHRSSRDYMGSEKFWACPYYQVFNYCDSDLRERHEGFVAFFEKIADQNRDKAYKIATKLLNKEINQELSALKRKNKKQIKEAFRIENNIIFYKSNLSKITNAFVKLFVKRENNYRVSPKTIYFPEIKKCINFNQAMDNSYLIDVVIGSDL